MKHPLIGMFLGMVLASAAFAVGWHIGDHVFAPTVQAQVPAGPAVTDHQGPRHAWIIWTDVVGSMQRVSLVRADDRCYLWFEVMTGPAQNNATPTGAGVSIIPRECPRAEKELTQETLKPR